MSRKRRKIRRARDISVGRPPGSIVVDSSAPKPEIDVTRFNPDMLETRKIENVNDIPHVSSDVVTWVNIIGLGDEKIIRRVADRFNLHDLAIEDVVNTHQRAKLEEYDDHFFIVLRLPSFNGDLNVEQISIFVSDNFVLTWQEHVGDCFSAIRARLESPKRMLRQRGSDFLAYSLIDSIVDAYFPVLARYSDELDGIEDTLIDGVVSKSPVAKLHHFRTEIRILRRDAWTHRELIRNLISNENPAITAETRLHFRDVLDHTYHLVELSETCRDSCSDINDMYMSFVGMRMNEVMKVLTIIATIFIPLSFVTGLYGMNFATEASPWNMPETRWYFGYPIVLGFMATIAAGMLIYFKRKGWLGTK